jgi:hypothetical protein
MKQRFSYTCRYEEQVEEGRKGGKLLLRMSRGKQKSAEGYSTIWFTAYSTLSWACTVHSVVYLFIELDGALSNWKYSYMFRKWPQNIVYLI